MNETSALWIPVGPAPIDATGFGVAGGVSGRVWTIAVSTNFDREGTAAIYLGIDGGGVWRSVDFTKSVPTWIPLLDHFPASFPLNRQVGLANIGALGIDPNNPWIIYAGSGDPADRGPNAYGQGLLKSIDGGNTWSLLSLGASTFTPGFARIFVDPTDVSGNTVYTVGGFGPNSPLRGIFKSNDGGATWNNIQNDIPAAVAVSDLDYAVIGNNLTLFAGVNDTTGRNGGVNGIWRSDDGGQSWAQMFIVPLTDVKGQPVQVNTIGLIKLAADRTPGTPHGVFAAISVGNTLANVFKLVGRNWMPSGNGLTAMNTTSAQSIGIAPDGSIYLGGVNDSRQNGLFQSMDGGATWKSIDVGSNGLRPHTDQHAWAFFAGAVYCGNDGGIYRFVPLPNQAPGPGTWESLNASSLQTILSQGLGTHPQYPNVILESGISVDSDTAKARPIA
jgi:photosystem II stability/assembly factor-like uncharacterized protein